MAALISIGSFDFPEPSTYSATTSDIVDSARNVKGYVIGAIVRSDVAKVEVSWRYLTVRQWAAINTCFKNSFYNDVTFFNQVTGEYTTRTMYVSDRTAGMWRRHPETGEVLGWTDCALSLVEV